ncbi:restriction endonuclease subunit S [Colwellia sp. UCD-KL20]|uniref:restriction endonuclease subunit S n=1 Tax=Colwellia sp. UCD-KL20 TaxID=1917165 RepID=UPI000970C36D|nr:restriction endonuclease subunit S [Colwellia sp. UCD-KL20]
MTDVHKLRIDNLITDNIDVWTSALKKRNSQGRGSNSKTELTGIKKLRELILELAVRGKLVPQDPNDEAASVLLERIESEKTKLISDKVIKKAKGVGASDMPPVYFDCPDGWSLPELTHLILNSADHIVDGPFGSNLKATEYVDSGIPLIRIQNVDRNVFKNNGIQYLTELKASSLSRHSFIAGDIVLNKLGEPTGKACIIPDYLTHGIIVADLIRVRVNEDFHNKNFLIYCINSPLVASQFSGLAKGVTRQRVNLSQVRSIKIPLPPLAEQHRIVAKVDELMALCDELEQQTEQSLSAHQTLVEVLLATLTDSKSANSFQENWQRISQHFDVLFTTEHSIEQLKQTILQLAVMGKLVRQKSNDEPASKLLEKIAEEKAQLIKDKKIKKQKPLPEITDEEKPFELPSGWKFERLGNLVSRLGSGSTPRGGQSAYVDKGIIFLRSQNVWNDGLKLDDTAYISDETHNKMVNTHVFPNDVLLNITGASLGRSTIFPEKLITANVSQHVTIIRLVEERMCEFVHLGIKSPLVQRLVWGRQVGMAIEGLSKKVLEQFEFPVPPLAEQKRIVAKVDELMALCDQLKTRLADTQTTQLHLADAVVENALG